MIFGDPGAGTAVMDAVPLAALDLPLKVLIWADGDQTNSPTPHPPNSPDATASAPTWRPGWPASKR